MKFYQLLLKIATLFLSFFILNSCHSYYYNFEDSSFSLIEDFMNEHYYFPSYIVKNAKIQSCIEQKKNVDGSFTPLRKYFFDKDGRVMQTITYSKNQDSSVYYSKFTSEGDILQEEFKDELGKSIQVKYLYNADKQLIKKVIKDDDLNQSAHYDYIYNNKQLERIEAFNNKEQIFNIKKFKYENGGKISKIINVYPFEVNNNRIYDYYYSENGNMEASTYIYISENRAFGNRFYYNSKGLLRTILSADIEDLENELNGKIKSKIEIEYNKHDLPSKFTYYLDFQENNIPLSNPAYRYFKYSN